VLGNEAASGGAAKRRVEAAWNKPGPAGRESEAVVHPAAGNGRENRWASHDTNKNKGNHDLMH